MKLDKIFELKLLTQIVCFRIVYANTSRPTVKRKFASD